MKGVSVLEPHFTGSTSHGDFKMKKLNSPESVATAGSSVGRHAVECWEDDTSVLEMDYFVEILSDIKAKGYTPDVIGLVLTHYASKWLPELSNGETKPTPSRCEGSPDAVTTEWKKKKYFVETLVEILPPEKDSVPCGFLLKLLRVGNTVGFEPTYRIELESRISWQLDEATLEDLMIPSFDYACRTVLDVELVHRLVQRFVNLYETSGRGAALEKVTKLVDSYLAEAAMDSNLTLPEFFALAGVVPSHTRQSDDGLYRAIDTFLRVHQDVSKQERKSLCRLIDGAKLSTEASRHAAQNEHLPVRAALQVLLRSSGSVSRNRSCSTALVPSSQTLSINDVKSERKELKKLHEEIYKLQFQYYSLQVQLEKLGEKKKGFFKLMKLRVPSFRSVDNRSEGKLLVQSRDPKSRRKSMS